MFELEFDTMMEYGELSEDLSCEYLKKVEGQPGYYRLLPSTQAKYLSPVARDSSKIAENCRLEYESFLQAFKDTSQNCLFPSESHFLSCYHNIKDRSYSWTSLNGELSTWPSYFLKTRFFHYTRSKHPDWWTDNDDVMIIASSEIYEEMEKCLTERNCCSFLVSNQQIIDFDNKRPEM